MDASPSLTQFVLSRTVLPQPPPTSNTISDHNTAGNTENPTATTRIYTYARRDICRYEGNGFFVFRGFSSVLLLESIPDRLTRLTKRLMGFTYTCIHIYMYIYMPGGTQQQYFRSDPAHRTAYRGIFTSLPDHPRSFTTLPTSKVYKIISVRLTYYQLIRHTASTSRYF